MHEHVCIIKARFGLISSMQASVLPVPNVSVRPLSRCPTMCDLQGTLLGLLTASGAELSILQSANRVVAAGAGCARDVKPHAASL